MANYIYVTHDKPEIKDLANFIIQTDFALIKNFTPSQLLNYKDDNGVTNKDRIFERYTLEEEKDNKNKPAGDLLIKYGTMVAVPKDNLNRDVLFTQGNFLVKNDSVRAFMARELDRLLKDQKYVQINKSNDATLGDSKDMYPNVTVWMWCRALTNENNLNGTIIDLSPFIQNINTNVAENGGNWDLSLSPLVCEIGDDGSWIITPASIKQYNAGNLRDSYVSEAGIHKTKNGKLKRNQFFFHNVINANDLIFIRFETLEIEAEKRIKKNNNFIISPQDLPNQIYDMIGLVDLNSISFSPESNDVGISVSGRDLIKVLIEDGSYFFPLEFAQGVFYNTGDNKNRTDLVQRSIASGNLLTLNAYIERSISFSLQFIVNQLANISIIPDELFSAYTNRSTQFRLDNSGDNLNQTQAPFKEQLMRGIWQIIKLIIDDSVASRRIVDSSIAQEQGSILNSIKKLVQEPFAEFYTDTIGDQFYFQVRQPPFNAKLFRALIYGDVKNEEANINYQGNNFDSRGFAINDSRKEIKIDEIGTNSTCIDIEELDILQEQLMFNDEEVYTWYRLTPQSVFFGAGSEMTLAFLPAIYIPELVDIYGAKPYDIVSNYVPYSPIVGAQQKDSLNYLEKQVFYDLKFVIDSKIYLPFTRKGSITINGDRRIKRGTTIRHKGTGEIYYVDAVSNSYAISDQVIDRVTTLQVSRGMVEEYVKGRNILIEGEQVFVSYFDIMRTNLLEEFFIVRSEGNTTVNTNVLKDWGINQKVLNFFLARKQFR